MKALRIISGAILPSRGLAGYLLSGNILVNLFHIVLNAKVSDSCLCRQAGKRQCH
jgi:hypothetical protein